MEEDSMRVDADKGASLVLPSLSLSEADGGVAVICFDQKDKKVNTLNSSLIPQFEQIFEHVRETKSIKSVVIISAKKDNFVAGADIEELRDAEDAEAIRKLSQQGQGFLNQLAELGKPVVAAINGSCLGGGLELALACHYRIASDNPKTVLGLPEVMLGLLPGAGGTQRLPRLIGLEKALDLMLTGKQVKATRALKMKLVDHVCTATGLEDMAIEAARRLAAKTLKVSREPKRNFVTMAAQSGLGRKFILQQALKQVLAKTRGLYPAPKAIIETVGFGLEHGMRKGLSKEADAFAKLAQTPEFRGLVSLYFAQNELKKNRFGEPVTKVKNLGVLGAGLMGAGISLVSVQKGFSVRMKDVNEENLGKGKKYVWDDLNQKVKRKSLSRFEAQRTLAHLYGELDYKYLASCELVIEAVFEDLDLKHRVLREIEAVCPDTTVFASNTSALPITKIAEASKRPEQVLGMHYFSPVPKMPLLEIIRTDKTAKSALSMAVDVGMRQGKTVIVVKDGPGFYTTRILAPFMDEAALLALEGVDFYTLDRAMMDFGYPVGPITLIDEVGIDVAYHVGHDLGEALGKRVSAGDPKILSTLVEKKCLGRKSGKGFYLYAKGSANPLSRLFGKKKREINPLAYELMLRERNGAKKLVSVQDMQKRMAYRMINEAVFCLQEGILARPLDGDIGAVFGLGFPPFHGGPFRYIDSQGAQNIVDDLKRYEESYGERFTPAQLLIDKANASQKFYEN